MQSKEQDILKESVEHCLFIVQITKPNVAHKIQEYIKNSENIIAEHKEQLQNLLAKLHDIHLPIRKLYTVLCCIFTPEEAGQRIFGYGYGESEDSRLINFTVKEKVAFFMSLSIEALSQLKDLNQLTEINPKQIELSESKINAEDKNNTSVIIKKELVENKNDQRIYHCQRIKHAYNSAILQPTKNQEECFLSILNPNKAQAKDDCFKMYQELCKHYKCKEIKEQPESLSIFNKKSTCFFACNNNESKFSKTYKQFIMKQQKTSQINKPEKIKEDDVNTFAKSEKAKVKEAKEVQIV